MEKFRFFYLGLLIVLGIVFLVPIQNVNAEDREDSIKAPLKLSSTDISNLKSLGFTEEEIKNMSKEEFKLNKGLKGTIIERQTKYYKVYENVTGADTNLRTFNIAQSTVNENSKSIEVELTREQYYNELKQLDLNDQPENSVVKLAADNGIGKNVTSYKTVTLTISKLNSGTNKYRLKLNVHWDKKMPKYRLTDVLAIGFNNSLWRAANEEYGKQTWNIFDSKKRTNTTGSATYTSSSNKWKYSKDGYALKMNLKDDPSSTQYVTDINMYMYYSVTPTKSLPKYLDAYGEYAHQESKYEISPTINFDGSGGLTITQSNYFTETNVKATLKTK